MANPRTVARIAARIKERLAHALEFELADPRTGFVTLTNVEVSSDLSVAKVYYSVLGTRGDRSRVAHMLEDARGFLQSKIARVLRVRRVPRLMWLYDDSIEYAAEMDKRIAEALARDQAIRSGGEPAPQATSEEWEAEYGEFLDEDEPGPERP